MEDFMLPCLNKQLFGIDCPGCGIQRAFLLVVRGDFAGAFKMYPAIYTLLLLGGFLIFNIFYRFKNDGKIKFGLIGINILIILISYIIKMNRFIN